jgi:hypothetical protein
MGKEKSHSISSVSSLELNQVRVLQGGREQPGKPWDQENKLCASPLQEKVIMGLMEAFGKYSYRCLR